MRRSFLYVLFLPCLLPILIVAANGQTHVQDEGGFYGNDAKAIEHLLRAQQQAWNRHDLEGFMAGYWRSPQLTFFSQGKEQDGWDATIQRYIARYASPGHEMGKLEFSALRIDVLSQDSAFVRGTWKLTMSDAKTPNGLFTLVLRKFPDVGWKIVHDHTSASE
ncbi:MAG: DUF4440 domain-containing protein [Candidatus Sulfotelmatobacter sp.]